MWSDSNLLEGNILAELFDKEDIIEKIQNIHELERKNRYTPVSRETTYWERVQLALDYFPPIYKNAVLSIFSNVVYLTRDMLREAMSMLSRDMAVWCGKNNVNKDEEVHFFVVDHPGLVDDFFEVGSPYGWRGRQDRIAQRSIRLVSSLLDELLNLLHGQGHRKLIQDIFHKKAWILLNDNSMSGGSARSDVEKLQKVLQLFGNDNVPEIVVVVQFTTDSAFEVLGRYINTDDNFLYGLRFDNRFKINHPECKLFTNKEVWESAKAACEWFADQNFPPELKGIAQEGLANTIGIHRKDGYQNNFAYGWKDSGYTLVTYKNCPSDSLPLLWFPIITDAWDRPQSVDYRPPFPRNHSRFKSGTSKDNLKLEELRTIGR